MTKAETEEIIGNSVLKLQEEFRPFCQAAKFGASFRFQTGIYCNNTFIEFAWQNMPYMVDQVTATDADVRAKMLFKAWQRLYRLLEAA